MKSLIKLWPLLPALSLALTALTSHAQTQGAGNGGDSIQIEVRYITKALSKMLERDSTAKTRVYPEVDTNTFKSASEKLVVKSVSDRLTDKKGDEKTAINLLNKDGSKLLYINFQRYRSTPAVIRQQLIFHEVLGLMGLEKSNDDHISRRLEVQVERPVYGLCTAKILGRKFIAGLKFDFATRVLEGAYTERDGDGNLYINGSLSDGEFYFTLTRVWNGYGAHTEGFLFKDNWIEMQVPTPPNPGNIVDFRLSQRVARTKDRQVQASGTCELSFD